jgi:hypothetical protein
VVGLGFESGLVKRILGDVKGAPAELPLLEHALLELYQYEPRKENVMTAQAYGSIGTGNLFASGSWKKSFFSL